MSEATRKKSTSSDSELSDGWSLVDHPDTAQLTARNQEMIPQLHTNLLQQVPPSSLKYNTAEEQSSDAESVEIIQEDHLNDYLLPNSISRVTKISREENEKEDKMNLECQQDKEIVESRELSLAESGSEYFINTSTYSNECFRLLIFISSIVALVLLLISYTSLFFKEQGFSKSDGLIVLPDEDLSSLIADLALFKEENNRLKEELNMIKYEYGNSKKIDKSAKLVPIDDSTTVLSTDDSEIGLEVISDDTLERTEKKPFIKQAKIPVANFNSEKPPKPLKQQNHGSQNGNKKEPLHDDSSNPETQQKRIEDLTNLEDDLKTFAKNIGVNDIIMSSYNIASNLNNINAIVTNLDAAIERETGDRKVNKKYQLQQKINKLKIKIEQDFKRSVEKVSKRVNKFYNEFAMAYCRIQNGVSYIDGLDCNNLKSDAIIENKKFEENKNNFNTVSYTQSAETEIKFATTRDEESSYEDDKIRYKRSNEYEGSKITKKVNEKEKYTEKQKKNRDNNYKTKKLKDEELNSDEELKNTKRSNVYDNNSEPKRGDKQEIDTEKIKNVKKFVNKEKIKTENEYKNKKIGNEKKIKYEKCTKKECEKRNEKINKQNFKVNKNKEAFMKIDSNKRPSTIHNESIYSKIINNNSRRKMEPNGEWYLDMGEVRSQKRLRRSNSKDRSGWLFDRALVRDWCRTNSGSSLCASFGQNCD